MLFLLNFATCAIGIFILVLFLFSKEKKLPFQIMGLHFSILLFLTIKNILFESPFISHFPFLLNASAPMGYLIGPLTYLFIRTLLTNQSKLTKKDALHFIPFLIHFIVISFLYFPTKGYKLDLGSQGIGFDQYDWVNLDFNPHDSTLHHLLQFLSANIYLFLAYKIFSTFKRSVPTHVINENKRLLRFSSQFLLIKVLTFAITVIGIILSIYRIGIERYVYDINLFLLIALNISLYVLNPNLLYGMQYSNVYTNASNEEMYGPYMKELGRLDESVFIDKDYNIIYFNKAAYLFAESVFGIPLIKGDNVHKYLSGEFGALFQNGFNEAIKGKSFEREYQVSTKPHAQQVWKLLTFQPVHGETTEIIGVVFSSKDITQMKFNEIIISDFKDELFEIAKRETLMVQSPVANILSLSSLFLKQETLISLDEKLSVLRYVNKEIERLDQIIYDTVQRANDLKTKKEITLNESFPFDTNNLNPGEIQ